MEARSRAAAGRSRSALPPPGRAARPRPLAGPPRRWAAQVLDRTERLAAVPQGPELRGIDVSNHAASVDYIGHAAREDAQGFRHAVERAHRTLPIAQQEEREPLAGGEPPVRRHGVGADADHRGSRLGEAIIASLERAGLESASRRAVLRIEIQHDRLLTEQV